MIKGGKNPFTPLFIIMQPFDQHFLLRRKTIVCRHFHLGIDLPETSGTKTIEISLRQERGRLSRDRDHTALAIGDIPHLTCKGLTTLRAIFFFVLFHRLIPVD
jgi:hypothetical protein